MSSDYLFEISQIPDIPPHIILLIHGLDHPLHSGANDFDTFSQILEKTSIFSDALIIKATSISTKTGQGIYNLAKSVYVEFRSATKKFPLSDVKSPIPFSIIGHSLGGIIARAVLEFFEPHFTGSAGLLPLLPCTFLPVTSPHLGVRRPAFLHPLNFLLNSAAPLLFWGSTIPQLNLGDTPESSNSQKIMEMLSTPRYISLIKHFKFPTLCANIKNDIQVPYQTAAISHRNPYIDTARKHHFLEKQWTAANNHFIRCSSLLPQNGLAVLGISGFDLPKYAEILTFEEFSESHDHGSTPTTSPSEINTHSTSTVVHKERTALLLNPAALYTWCDKTDHPATQTSFDRTLSYQPIHVIQLNSIKWRRIDLYGDSIFTHDKAIGKPTIELLRDVLNIRGTYRWLKKLADIVVLDHSRCISMGDGNLDMDSSLVDISSSSTSHSSPSAKS